MQIFWWVIRVAASWSRHRLGWLPETRIWRERFGLCAIMAGTNRTIGTSTPFSGTTTGSPKSSVLWAVPRCDVSRRFLRCESASLEGMERCWAMLRLLFFLLRTWRGWAQLVCLRGAARRQVQPGSAGRNCPHAASAWYRQRAVFRSDPHAACLCRHAAAAGSSSYRVDQPQDACTAFLQPPSRGRDGACDTSLAGVHRGRFARTRIGLREPTKRWRRSCALLHMLFVLNANP